METTVKEVHFSSAARACPTLRPHELQHSRPPVHHQLLGFTQTLVHWSIICSMCSLLGILRLAELNLVNKLFILPFISQIQITINEEHKIPQLDSDIPSIYDLFATTPWKIRLFLTGTACQPSNHQPEFQSDLFWWSIWPIPSLAPQSPPLVWARPPPRPFWEHTGPVGLGKVGCHGATCPPWASLQRWQRSMGPLWFQGCSFNVQLLLSPTTISHNSHESGLIYSQEIQTHDMTSKGLFICMGKRSIPKYSLLLPTGVWRSSFKTLSPRPLGC